MMQDAEYILMVWWIVAGHEDDGTIYANGDSYDGYLMLWQCEPDGMLDNW